MKEFIILIVEMLLIICVWFLQNKLQRKAPLELRKRKVFSPLISSAGLNAYHFINVIASTPSSQSKIKKVADKICDVIIFLLSVMIVAQLLVLAGLFNPIIF